MAGVQRQIFIADNAASSSHLDPLAGFNTGGAHTPLFVQFNIKARPALVPPFCGTSADIPAAIVSDRSRKLCLEPHRPGLGRRSLNLRFRRWQRGYRLFRLDYWRLNHELLWFRRRRCRRRRFQLDRFGRLDRLWLGLGCS